MLTQWKEGDRVRVITEREAVALGVGVHDAPFSGAGWGDWREHAGKKVEVLEPILDEDGDLRVLLAGSKHWIKPQFLTTFGLLVSSSFFFDTKKEVLISRSPVIPLEELARLGITREL